jgi:NTE family protein
MDPIGTLRQATDIGFLNHARRTILPLPLIDGADSPPGDALPPFERRPSRSLQGKRIGVVGRGGVATAGLARAFEEAGVRPAAIAANRESAIWAAMWAGGMTADEMAEASLRWRPQDHLGIQWAGAPRLVVSAARGFSGLDKARALEQLVPRALWRMSAGQTEVPFRTPVRDLDFGGVEYFGTETTPDLTLGELVRIACAAPRRGDAVRVEGGFYVGDDPAEPPLDPAGFDRVVTCPHEPVGFVNVFIDRRGWPELIRRGHAGGAAALATGRRRSGRRA